MKLYVASSWRNRFQTDLVARLRELGHSVYDFKNPNGDGPNTGFGWQQIDPNWRTWTPEQYKQALTHAIAQKGFESDERGMIRADGCVLCMPSGRSAHVEWGWMLGRGQLAYVLLNEEGFEPDLMYLLTPFTRICLNEAELVQRIAEDDERLRNDELRPEYDTNTLRERASLRYSSANPPLRNMATFRVSTPTLNMEDATKNLPPILFVTEDENGKRTARHAASGRVYMADITTEWLKACDYEMVPDALQVKLRRSLPEIRKDDKVYLRKTSSLHEALHAQNNVPLESANNLASEIVLPEGGVCNLPVHKIPLLVHIAPSEPNGWHAASVTTGNVYKTNPNRIDLEADLVTDGYKLINPRLRERLESCSKFVSADVYIHAPQWQQAEENFEKVKDLLP